MPRRRYDCKVCGKWFESYNLNAQFCSIRCKAEAQSAKIDPETVEHFYWSLDMTQEEIADLMGTSQKVIYSLMKRHGMKTKVAKKRNQRGSSNDSWKGSKAGYQALHVRVAEMRGKPSKCETCGTTDSDRHYDWASMTGNFANIWDYKRLCRSCHWQYDKTIFNIKHMRPQGARKEKA